METSDVILILVAIGAVIWMFWPLFRPSPPKEEQKPPPKPGTFNEDDWY